MVYYILVFASILLIVLNIIQKTEKKTNHTIKEFPYIKRDLLTKTEYRFYRKLKEKTDENNMIICPKVRLEDFIDVTDSKNKFKYRGYIKSRHVDFLLCDKDLNILAGIELDDRTHKYKKAKEVDEFKNKLFQTIGIPLNRIATSGNYNIIINHLIELYGKKEELQENEDNKSID